MNEDINGKGCVKNIIDGNKPNFSSFNNAWVKIIHDYSIKIIILNKKIHEFYFIFSSTKIKISFKNLRNLLYFFNFYNHIK